MYSLLNLRRGIIKSVALRLPMSLKAVFLHYGGALDVNATWIDDDWEGDRLDRKFMFLEMKCRVFSLRCIQVFEL